MKKNGYWVDWDNTTLREVKANSSYQSNSRVRNHARRVYTSSGRDKCCLVCGYSLHIDIAHKKEIKEFDLDTTMSIINDVDNLIALCKNHHWELDNGFLMLGGCPIRKKPSTYSKTICPVCHKTKFVYSKVCYGCSRPVRRTKIAWPTTDELIKELKEISCRELGRRLGVSDNAIRKRIKNHH